MKKWLFLLMLPLTACGPELIPGDELPGDDLLSSTEQNVIVGSVDWISTNSLSGTEATRAQAVGYLSIPAKGSRCTAWLIASDRIVTNNHCIKTSAEASGAQVSFNYIDGVSSTSRIWYPCSTLVKTWSAEDMTVLRCSAVNGQLPGNVYGWLTVATTNPGLSQNLYLLHQNCDYYTTSGCSPTRKYSPGVVTNTAYDSLNIAYNADTLGGSSGSPVLAKDGTNAHRVIALHHWGLGGDSSGRGTGNAGVKATALRARLAEIGL